MNMNKLPWIFCAAVVFLTACGGGSSGPSNPVSTLTFPGTPLNVTVSAGDALATINFSAPSSDGGSAITSYTATCTNGSAKGTQQGTTSPLLVAALTNGSTYACSVVATNAQGTGSASSALNVTPVASSLPLNGFTLTSPVAAEGGTLPVDYTCDGFSASPALSWRNAPAGTQEFALVMSTIPSPGTVKYNWVLYKIASSVTDLAKDNYAIGTAGLGSDGPLLGYQAPCSQGPGAKTYTFTLYALSKPVSLSGSGIGGSEVLSAISASTLSQASLNVSATRTTPSSAATHCTYVRDSVAGSTTGTPAISCDASYAYMASSALPSHTMMSGITATNLQVPIAQNFWASNAWRIPLNPAIASTTTSAVDGPIGVAINGVPIFNPCKQGGCQNGDTKLLGELDSCNGHAGRADDYHYHAAPVCMMAGKASNYWDTHPVGWALDGFAIMGYNNPDGTKATRDAVCGGNTVSTPNAPAGYSYHVTDTSPYVLSCFRGTPSPDLAGQGAKYSPIRQPPVTPFAVSGMSLTGPVDGMQTLQFTSSQSFTTTATGSDSVVNKAGSYQIRYTPLSGVDLVAALALSANKGKSSCWRFEFLTTAGASSQPAQIYCR